MYGSRTLRRRITLSFWLIPAEPSLSRKVVHNNLPLHPQLFKQPLQRHTIQRSSNKISPRYLSFSSIDVWIIPVFVQKPYIRMVSHLVNIFQLLNHRCPTIHSVSVQNVKERWIVDRYMYSVFLEAFNPVF